MLKAVRWLLILLGKTEVNKKSLKILLLHWLHSTFCLWQKHFEYEFLMTIFNIKSLSNSPDNQLHLPEFDYMYKLTKLFVRTSRVQAWTNQKDVIAFGEFINWSKFRLLQRSQAGLVSNCNAFQKIQFCCL